MHIEYLKGTTSDFDDIIDFGNYVFSHHGVRTDFPTILPKLYNKDVDTTSYHYLVKESGKIKAMLGSFPLEMDILGEKISIRGIGTVSVHPYSRGNGYMKELMNMALNDMKNDGVDFSCLGGQRQRYEYFSYAPTGQKISFNISSENIRHKLCSISDDYKFKEVTSSDTLIINRLYGIYNSKTIKVIRPQEQFFDILRSWNCNISAIFKNDTIAGYIVLSSDNHVMSEFTLIDNIFLTDVIGCLFKETGISYLNLDLPIYEVNYIKEIKRICESYSINTSYLFSIFNYEKIIRLLLKLKATYKNLQDGNVRIAIENYGTLSITVKNNQISIEKTLVNEDISLTHFEAMDLIFSPLNLYSHPNDILNQCMNSWFPLPLHIPNLDHI